MTKFNLKKKIPSLSQAQWIIFLLIFIYFDFFANYLFFYQEKLSLFIFSFDFLKESLHQPGGLLVYVSKLMTSFFYYPTLGAIIVTSVIALSIKFTSEIIRILTGKKFIILPFIIGSFLFYQQTNYQFALFNHLGLLLQLGLFIVTIKYTTIIKGWIPFIIAPFWYFATGGFSWIYSLMFTMYLIFIKDKCECIKVIALVILSLLIIFISKEYLFYQSVETLLFYPFSQNDTSTPKIVFLTLAGTISLLPVLSRINLKLAYTNKASEFLVGITAIIFPFIVILFIGFQQFDKKHQQYFHVERLFYEKKYEELIEYNITHPTLNSMTIFLNNIALFETGQLNDMLFHFPQNPDGRTLFLKWDMNVENLRLGGYFYFAIGMTNEAHRWAYENMVIRGHTPEGLKMLIKTDLINGNFQMAGKYIALLKKTFFYRNEAKQYELMLLKKNDVESNQELKEKQQIRVKSDFFIIPEDPFLNLEKMLKGDAMNRNAFEYKLAFLLLKKDSKSIMAELPKFEAYGFKKLPVHIEEAFVAYKLLKLAGLPKLENLTIDPKAELKFKQFITEMQLHGNNLKSARPALREKFGNTFWFYAFYQ